MKGTRGGSPNCVGRPDDAPAATAGGATQRAMRASAAARPPFLPLAARAGGVAAAATAAAGAPASVATTRASAAGTPRRAAATSADASLGQLTVGPRMPGAYADDSDETSTSIGDTSQRRAVGRITRRRPVMTFQAAIGQLSGPTGPSSGEGSSPPEAPVAALHAPTERSALPPTSRLDFASDGGQ